MNTINFLNRCLAQSNSFVITDIVNGIYWANITNTTDVIYGSSVEELQVKTERILMEYVNV